MATVNTAFFSNYVHMLSINIPGGNVARGDIIISYFPPFTYALTPDGQLDRNNRAFVHRYVFLVFEQPRGRVTLANEGNYCSKEAFLGRLKVRFKGLASANSGEFVLLSFRNVFFCFFSIDHFITNYRIIQDRADLYLKSSLNGAPTSNWTEKSYSPHAGRLAQLCDKSVSTKSAHTQG
jgi:hypothetical protein